jgi:hypothetical protein
VWKKGQSGNPKGRPSRANDLNEMLWSLAQEKKGGKGKLKDNKKINIILQNVVDSAVKNKEWAIKYFYDRFAGPIKQIIEHEGIADFGELVTRAFKEREKEQKQLNKSNPVNSTDDE